MITRKIILVVPDIRSIHNVGSLLRTAEGLGVDHVYLCGYTPHPTFTGDTRLPHVARRHTNQIAKTALGAEQAAFWSYLASVEDVLIRLKQSGYSIQALEQTEQAVPLPEFVPPSKVAVVLGSEVEGLSQALLDLCDGAIEIPMFGKKESFNVVEAASMALYHCRFK